MFGVKHNECVGFESRWKVVKVSASTTAQTTEYAVSETSTNTIESATQEVQTDATELKPLEVDMNKLAEWLKKIYPNVKDQMESISNSEKIFKNYRRLNDPIDTTCKLVQSIDLTIKTSETKAIPFIKCIQWNQSGTILAVSYNYKHKTWCHHVGVVCVYTLLRDNTLSESPKKRFSTESCVTSIRFHPFYSHIVAAATFTGHIYIWTIDNDLDPLICHLAAHDEYLTQLSWFTNLDKSISLATSSTDGLLKIWTFNLAKLQLKTIYKIRTPLLAKINESTEVAEELFRKTSLGVVAFDFSPHVADRFLVATEGGLIARCSMLGANKTKGLDTEPMYDPVQKYYEPHRGEVMTVKWFPTRKEMFLTSATDGEIRIYLMDQDDPAQVIYTKTALNDVSFIIYEEKLLAGCSQTGSLELYNLINGKHLKPDFNNKDKRSLTSMAINNIKINYVVFGNNVGQIQLWTVPWSNLKFED